MAEQEMDLDTAIEEFRLINNFEEYEEGLLKVLSPCHTREELNRANAVIDEEKKRLLETNPEFKTIMDQRKRNAKMKSEEERATHKAVVAGYEADANRLLSKAKAHAAAARAESGLEDLIPKARMKIRTPEEAEAEKSTGLVCPICKDKDHGNILNNKPTCMKCMHILVPKEDLGNYNRAYRRRWKKKR